MSKSLPSNSVAGGVRRPKASGGPALGRLMMHGMAKKSARKATRPAPKISFYPATASRWADLERLFGERGACGGCWCMTWRLPRKEFSAGKGAGNRRAFKRIVESDARPGVLAYSGGEA